MISPADSRDEMESSIQNHPSIWGKLHFLLFRIIFICTHGIQCIRNNWFVLEKCECEITLKETVSNMCWWGYLSTAQQHRTDTSDGFRFTVHTPQFLCSLIPNETICDGISFYFHHTVDGAAVVASEYIDTFKCQTHCRSVWVSAWHDDSYDVRTSAVKRSHSLLYSQRNTQHAGVEAELFFSFLPCAKNKKNKKR